MAILDFPEGQDESKLKDLQWKFFNDGYLTTAFVLLGLLLDLVRTLFRSAQALYHWVTSKKINQSTVEFVETKPSLIPKSGSKPK